MARIDCLVDTRPMANSIDKVSTQVTGTTTAVVAMKSAVVKAETDAANKVCNDVNKGFYSLIHSQISQKMARLQSEVDSLLMKLNQQRKQVLSIQKRMERDYNMITSRYLKLFNGLNKNLEQRVYELDKPTIELAVKQMNTISNRGKFLTATVPVSQTESLTMSQKIIASNIKFKGMKVIESMSNFLDRFYIQEALTQNILLPIQTNREKEEIMIPILISESNYDAKDNKHIDVAITNDMLTDNMRQSIEASARENEANMAWHEQETISEEIVSEFNKLVKQSSASERVKKMTATLFNKNKFRTI